MATDAPDLARLRSVVERTRPLSLAEQRLLPLTAATEHLLPRGGIVRGSTVEVTGASGATTLALSLVAGPCNSGSWVAVVGFEELGWEAAEEVGVPLERLVVVRCPPRQSSRVVAALLDSFDLVLCGPRFVPGQADLRRLRARARERGSALVGVGAEADNSAFGGSGLRTRPGRPWPSCDVRLVVRRSRWQGLGQGSGRLTSRHLEVLVSGRGELSRPRVEQVRLDATGAPVAEAPARRLDGRTRSALQAVDATTALEETA
jgi:hypothetical protein